MSKSSSQKQRDQRFRLWLRHGRRCFWCNRLTIFPRLKDMPKVQPDNLATIDHVYSRLNPLRRKCGGTNRVVLACYRCNQERSKLEHLSLTREELHARSGRTPAMA